MKNDTNYYLQVNDNNVNGKPDLFSIDEDDDNFSINNAVFEINEYE